MIPGQVTGQVGHLKKLSEPKREVLILEGEMSRDDLMTLLELKHNAKAINRRVIDVANIHCILESLEGDIQIKLCR